MENVWQLNDAKKKFSKLIEKTQCEVPQIVTKHGKECIVILSIEEYQKMIQSKTSLVKFFQEAPLAKSALIIDRDKSTSRDAELKVNKSY
jgi:antitoxin Phd